MVVLPGPLKASLFEAPQIGVTNKTYPGQRVRFGERPGRLAYDSLTRRIAGAAAGDGSVEEQHGAGR
jgi:hypothetical protein